MKVPKNWNNVPLENFTHYMEYINEAPEDIQGRIDLIKKRSCAVLGCTVKEVEGLTGEQQNELKKLMLTPMPSRLLLSFKHKGKRYRPLIYSKDRKNTKILEVVKDIYEKVGLDTKEFNGGKYSAFKGIQHRGTIKYLHQILFLCCKRVNRLGKEVELKPHEIEQGIEDFKTLPLEVAYPMFVFFLKVSERLKDVLNDYSKSQIAKIVEDMELLQADLEQDMDGLQ